MSNVCGWLLNYCWYPLWTWSLSLRAVINTGNWNDFLKKGLCFKKWSLRVGNRSSCAVILPKVPQWWLIITWLRRLLSESVYISCKFFLVQNSGFLSSGNVSLSEKSGLIANPPKTILKLLKMVCGNVYPKSWWEHGALQSDGVFQVDVLQFCWNFWRKIVHLFSCVTEMQCGSSTMFLAVQFRRNY